MGQPTPLGLNYRRNDSLKKRLRHPVLSFSLTSSCGFSISIKKKTRIEVTVSAASQFIELCMTFFKRIKFRRDLREWVSVQCCTYEDVYIFCKNNSRIWWDLSSLRTSCLTNTLEFKQQTLCGNTMFPFGKFTFKHRRLHRSGTSQLLIEQTLCGCVGFHWSSVRFCLVQNGKRLCPCLHLSSQCKKN